MPSPFDALDAGLSAAVLSTFGETTAATLRPWTRSEYVDGADTARPIRQIRGVFTAAPSEALLKGAVAGVDFNGVTRLSVTLAEYWLPASTVAALPYRIAKGDRIQFPARPGAPVYEVSELHETDTGDLNLILAREGEA